MSKARMTIRFDHEAPKRQENSGHKDEVHVAPRPEPLRKAERYGLEPDFVREKIQSPIHQKAGKEDLRVIPPPAELLNHKHEYSRVNGRLAEERRRKEQQKHHRHEEDNSQERPEYIEDGRVEPVEIGDWSSEHEFSHPLYDNADREHTYLQVEQIPSKSGNKYGYYRPNKPNSMWKLVASIAGAIITGLLFGSFILSMFNGGDSEKGTENVAGTTQFPLESTAVQEGNNDPNAAGAVPVSVSIPQQTFYMLQYGVFSTPEGAEQAMSELMQSGIAAFADSSGENRVYAGVSPDREQAKLLSNQLKGEGVELYVREVTMPGAQSAVFGGDAAALDIFFEVSGKLTENLSSISATLLGQGAPEPVDAERMKTITDLHLQWTEAVKFVNSGMSPETGANLKTMEQEMNGSITALTEYNKNRAKGHLWEIQAGMMNYIANQRKLVESLQS
ncbi:SPOR domain-containing protein [Paenibacillus faecalis]|uniref:SPOR domain-containing protein n=1 Tax=Paenibacillus faecalis TaxID=2079532 RepID=UPI00131A50A1|nr:SPOR domain-containing protein [Paenibacillus faecalis]